MLLFEGAPSSAGIVSAAGVRNSRGSGHSRPRHQRCWRALSEPLPTTKRIQAA